jgi:acetyltransferase-like isoleucine patch superfamily enzyme
VSIIEAFVWLLPGSALKNKLLRMFGHDIAPSARIGSVLAHNLVHVVIGEDSTISALNIFRSLRLLKLGDGVGIGKLNTITAFPGFQALDPDGGCLVMDNGSFITSRHYFDCSGGVEMGQLSAFCGHRTTLLTHEIDMSTNEQTAGRVIISERSAVLTNCVVLKGAYLPPRSLLAAHSTLIKAKDPNPASGLYAGTPAKCIAPVPSGSDTWFEREISETTKLRIDLSLGRLGGEIDAL